MSSYQHIGQLIQHLLEERGLSIESFHQQLDWSWEKTNALMNGQLQITLPVAEKLKQIFLLPLAFWIDFDQSKRGLKKDISFQELKVIK